MKRTAAYIENVVATIEKPFLSEALVTMVQETLAAGPAVKSRRKPEPRKKPEAEAASRKAPPPPPVETRAKPQPVERAEPVRPARSQRTVVAPSHSENGGRSPASGSPKAGGTARSRTGTSRIVHPNDIRTAEKREPPRLEPPPAVAPAFRPLPPTPRPPKTLLRPRLHRPDPTRQRSSPQFLSSIPFRMSSALRPPSSRFRVPVLPACRFRLCDRKRRHRRKG